jgi:ubiquinone/menaquinone biosynthesis C-methylase UbiE
MRSLSLIDEVQSKYAAVADSSLSNEHTGVRSVASAFGYTAEQLALLPAEANMGLSCGNPTATANLKPGEVVVDLGSGGGIDVLLASLAVGPTGKAIGIDMTPEMIARAEAGAKKFGQGQMPSNVDFRLGKIDAMPIESASADCLISNCVINLAPDKSAVFREMFRVLKPGGRVAISDIALKMPLPDEIGQDLLAYVGCIAGALLMDDYQRLLREAGFAEVQIVDTKKDLNAYASIDNQTPCCGEGQSCSPTNSSNPAASNTDFFRRLADLLARHNVNDYAASVQVYALKA